MGTSIITIVSVVASTITGGVVAAVTVVSLVGSQTAEPATSPVNVSDASSQQIEYGSN